MSPPQKPGKSKQDYETPKAFVDSVEARWGRLDVDLAASEENAKAPLFLTQTTDSLSVDWVRRFRGKACWLNPPYADLAPWAEKCAAAGPAMGQGRIYLLTPASVGANWFAEHVHRRALVLGISPRLQFVGTDAVYPKDLMLSVFAPGLTGFDVWRWK